MIEAITLALGWAKNHAKYIGAIAIAVALFFAGWCACKHFDANVVVQTEVKTVEKEVPIEIPVQVKGDTEIRYIEKETPADADVEINSSAPVISVAYNGEKSELKGLTEERQKFEKGKLQVEQKSETTLDVTPIVDREVAAAVKANTEELNKVHAEELKKEKHKRHKRELESFLAGAGVGLAIVAF